MANNERESDSENKPNPHELMIQRQKDPNLPLSQRPKHFVIPKGDGYESLTFYGIRHDDGTIEHLPPEEEREAIRELGEVLNEIREGYRFGNLQYDPDDLSESDPSGDH